MSVLIKGMEMPTSCDDCILNNGITCYAVPDYKEDGVVGRTDDRPDWCPLVPVPPHGRLIDADALMLEIQEYIEEYGWETDEHGWHNEKWCAMKEAAMVIDAAPTILEAEEGE